MYIHRSPTVARICCTSSTRTDTYPVSKNMYLVYYCRYRCICCVHTSLALRRSPAVAHPPSLTRRRSCWLYAAVVPGTNCCSSNVPGTTYCCCNLPGTCFCVCWVYIRYKSGGGRAMGGERRRANERTTAGERASRRRRASDDGGQRLPERRWRRRASDAGRATAGERQRAS